MRIKVLQGKIPQHHLCWITDPHNIFYFTGLACSSGTLLVAKTAACLFVDGRYIQAAKKQASVPVALEDGEEEFHFCQQNGVKCLFFDGSRTSYDQYKKLSLWRKKCEEFQIRADTKFFRTLRSIKDAQEIAALKKSAALNWRGFHFLCKQLQEGVTEKELACAFELYVLEHGADRLSFPPIIAFGAHSAMPHYKPSDCPLKPGDLVLMDIGVIVEDYCSDLTRVVAFRGIPKGFDQLYNIVREAQKAALSHICPGVKVRELDLAARNIMRREGVEELYLHSLGHGLGLEIHEFPRLRSTGEDHDVILEEGMAITIEPGLYRSEQGGIRYEDTVIITKTGYENLYAGTDVLPKV